MTSYGDPYARRPRTADARRDGAPRRDGQSAREGRAARSAQAPPAPDPRGTRDGHGSGRGQGGTYGSSSRSGPVYGSGGASGAVYGSRGATASGQSSGSGAGRGTAGSGGSGRGDRPGGGGARGSGTAAGRGSGKSGGPRKRHSPLWAKLVIALGSLVMVAAVGTMVGINVLFGEVNSAVTQVNMIDHGAQPVNINGAINMLMVGLDTRDNNPAMGSRSDSIIIAHVPASHDEVDLVSIPRDTYIYIPPNPKTHWNGGKQKINAAFEIGSQGGGGKAGGMQLLQKTIGQAWGIDFQAALIVNFDGFTDIVNKLGGVTMYVDEETMSLHHGYVTGHPNEAAKPWAIYPDGTPNYRIPGTTPVVYHKGTQHLSAYQALDYVRCRDFLPNSDYDRQRHQQQFVKALLQEAYRKGISDPTKISDFLRSLSKAFVFDGGGRSLTDWIFTLKGISPSAIRTLKINNGTYNTVMVGTMSTQQMSATSLELLADVKADKVEEFIARYPSWVSNS